MGRVRLPRTGEPKWYKDVYRRDKARSPDLARAALKQGTWFVKPYWDQYKQLLKDMGVTWQMLMEAWGYSNTYFVRWAEGEISWEEAFSKFEEALNRVVERMLGTRAWKFLGTV